MKKICSVLNCNREFQAIEFCNVHYMRFKRYGDINFRKKHPKHTWDNVICAKEGCDKKAQTKAMCRLHYQQEFKKLHKTYKICKGYTYKDGKYQVCIMEKGKYRYLGRFNTPEEAHQVYLQAKNETAS